MGGAERVLAALATADRPGWEQAVVNVSGHNRELAAACAPKKVRTSSTGPPVLASLRAATSVLTEFRPDVVHAHLPLAMVTVAALRRRGERVRVATHHHGDHFVASRRRFAARLDRVAGARFDAVAAPSEAVRAFLLSRYRYAGSTVRTIPNGWAGRAVASFPPGKAPDPTVISIANFRPEKNHEMLLRAFGLVHEQIPRMRLLLVGAGTREGAIRQLVDSLGLRSVVEFTGYVEDVWPYLSRSHLFVLASNYETLGVAILEAMAAGLPVVATAVGGVPELVRPGVNGELVEPGDSAGMAAAIIRILGSRGLMDSLGAAGRATAAEHTSEKMVDHYFTYYAELLATQTPP
jgi:glycosyltransferase involved in cell wall biosynthesis